MRVGAALVVLLFMVQGCDIGPGYRSSRTEEQGRDVLARAPAPTYGPTNRKRSTSTRRAHAGGFVALRCKPRRVPGPGRPYLLRSVDFGRDGRREWAWIDVGRLTITDGRGRRIASTDTPAAPLEGVQWPPGYLTVAYGRSRALRNAKFSVYTYSLQGSALSVRRLRIPRTTRPDLGTMKARDGSLWLTHFLSKYSAHTLVFGNPEGAPHEMVAARMLFDAEPVGDTVAYVRLYGDRKASKGGAFLREGGSVRALGTLSGGRALALCDLGDGPRLYVADGWDKAYRDKAKALVTVFSPRSWKKVGSYHLPEGIGVMEMECADIDGERGEELVLRTDRALYVLRKGGELILLGRYRGSSTPIQVADVDGDSMGEIVITEIPGYCEVR